jgi:DNA repair exonuclease SbcCD nuclease subunit
MKVALIADLHFGIRNGSTRILDNQKLFYEKVFFPTLKEQGINVVLNLGDTFDKRKGIDFLALQKSKEMFFDPLKAAGIKMHSILGNHDVYYRGSNELNSVGLILNEYDNITVYVDPAELDMGDYKFLMLPWINSDNHDNSMKVVRNTTASKVIGHLELNGFEMHRGTINNHGMDKSVFDKFEAVYTGHFHHKSSDGNIHYLGAPSQYTWSDWEDDRGFHILDLSNNTMEFVKNPHTIFHKFIYDDSVNDYTDILRNDESFKPFAGGYIKVVVVAKENPFWLETIVSKIEGIGVADVQVVDSHFNLDIASNNDIIEQTEDTITILKKYTASTIKQKKKKESVDKVLLELFNEAQNYQSEVN